MELPARLVFGCEATSPRAQREAALLAASIRDLAGAFSGCGIWALVLDPLAVASEAARRLAGLGVEVLPYAADEVAAGFPFTGRLLAAAHAEALAEERGVQLVWLDSGSLVLREPGALALPAAKALGCRPVDHTNIGSPWDAPLDDYWRLVYDRCGVAPDSAFPVRTTVRGREIRAHFNAGLLVVSPERGVLREWRRRFAIVCRDPAFEPLYHQRPLRRVFVHQAVLAGTVLALLDRDDIVELPPAVNYPLHMHRELAAGATPVAPEHMVTCRYEDLLEGHDWRRRLPFGEPVLSWLADRIGSPEFRPVSGEPAAPEHRRITS